MRAGMVAYPKSYSNRKSFKILGGRHVGTDWSRLSLVGDTPEGSWDGPHVGSYVATSISKIKLEQ
ncbi:hypothetical protein GGD62_003429 [Bradyrhizobium sp. ERR14]|nr:hypothetical protein [Bradyrhizobium sp. ERR14]